MSSRLINADAFSTIMFDTTGTRMPVQFPLDERGFQEVKDACTDAWNASEVERAHSGGAVDATIASTPFLLNHSFQVHRLFAMLGVEDEKVQGVLRHTYAEIDFTLLHNPARAILDCEQPWYEAVSNHGRSAAAAVPASDGVLAYVRVLRPLTTPMRSDSTRRKAHESSTALRTAIESLQRIFVQAQSDRTDGRLVLTIQLHVSGLSRSAGDVAHALQAHLTESGTYSRSDSAEQDKTARSTSLSAVQRLVSDFESFDTLVDASLVDPQTASRRRYIIEDCASDDVGRAARRAQKLGQRYAALSARSHVRRTLTFPDVPPQQRQQHRIQPSARLFDRHAELVIVE